MTTWLARVCPATAVALCLLGATASTHAQAPEPEAEVAEALLTGVEVSGYWRHTGESGAEWRLVVRDPTGELLRLDSVDVEHRLGRWDVAQPGGEAIAPERSLLLDTSGPEEAEGPHTVTLEWTRTALSERLGFSDAMAGLRLHDSVFISASPDLENLNLAFGVGAVLPSALDFGSRRWAHFLRASLQLERLSPEDQEVEVSGLGAVHAYWGRGWGWTGRLLAKPVLDGIREAISAAVNGAGEEGLGDPALVDLVLASATVVPAWRELAMQCATLEGPIGPGSGQCQHIAADLPALSVFLSELGRRVRSKLDEPELATRVERWAAEPQVFLDDRLLAALREWAITDNALDQIPPLSRREAFRQSRAAGVEAEELLDDVVSLAILVDAIDPRVLSVYHELVTSENPAGDLPEELRNVVNTSFMTVPWGPHTAWHERVAAEVAQRTLVWKPRLTFALDASAYANWGSDLDPAALLDARVTWRPDPFAPYGLTLAHKRGKEESDRTRRIDWSSVEFTYRF